MSAARPDDQRLVRRAALVIAAQTAAAVAIVVIAVAALVLFLTVREQRVDGERIVRAAAQTAQDATSPPPGVALLIRQPDGTVATSAGVPEGLRSLDLAALPAGLSEATPPVDARTDSDYRPHYQLFVADHDGRRVVAALDSRYRAYETRRLITSLSIAGLLGVAAAAGVGWLIGTQAVRPLGSALALQRRFVADASHELRTPLTILHTRAQMLARRTDLDPRTREDLRRLVDDSRMLSDIIDDLLLSAELQHRPGDRERVDITALARSVAESFAPTAGQAGVDLTIEAPPDPVLVAGIPVALRRALNALVDNALNHTHTGGSVTLRVRTADGRVNLAVVDDGDGLDPAATAALTERFARGPQTHAGRGRRFGLGLALVREIVHAHGGTFTLDGRPSAGATATITMPPAP
ncbi:sensor histidine kinase [Catellatospora chokoriensis]|uniref:histidine kinase n=1 Tax=Catellatospora chokoriensis TaxID=310353 RepID=A0A8J3K9B9_9ACTN|nr:HAMP domain-containing sensor histidine kinase [Catellatospora chokoriensis]GIF93030.1 two-component sensor histidine kinase [Catellatospora chokoriensis]